ncbi:hypothetical protein BAUCODRAFT_187359 [Baudoinia panamericana UAMH 10762]|uniref:Aromatic amino acid beta-eliminating lyase/threonine aldolase domain-containing protein n=1 Tax=Baudoinia panamericana (strain UAMH 10762) TaxID=717646 RepID=M2M1E2_BAUPA|nr:uncharacterized protein BAUCODRAFT_187359 [Baudoinia panamericana UAMH 10762]EMD00868.1 hypothetical protein BAUCODRAFT_187359 [Baudoinia panamericana UAMH 10762]
MANTSTETAIPTADCDKVDEQANIKSEPIQLCLFSEPISATDAFARTARYAADPTEYLREALGSGIFEVRKTMLSLPKTVDMDRYGTGAHKQHFEHHIANFLGKKHALFFVTGVQAQLAALKIYCDRAGRQIAAWHISSHLESAEERSFEALYSLRRVLLGSDPEALPTLDEIKKVLELPETERPAVVVIEVPNRVLGCKTYTFEQLARISHFCKEAGVALHMDGARLWEIEPYYNATAGKSFIDVVSLFDTVYVSFYKALRGITGAMLVSDDESMIDEAKVWQRRAGGNCYSLAFNVTDCERGYNENIGTFSGKRQKMIEIVDAINAATAKYKTPDGRRIVNFVPEKATCCQIHTVFAGFLADELVTARDTVRKATGVSVFERLRPKETVDEKMREERSKQAAKTVLEGANPDKDRQFMEWMITSVNEKLETKVFVDVYVALCNELVKERK